MSHAIDVSAPSAASAATESKRLAPPTTLARGRVDWPYAISFALYHVVALLAFWPWLFSWTGLCLALAGTYVFGTLGINLCYHRLLTHRSFDCPKWLERCLAILGVCCLQDTPARWVGVHRLHHQFSDESPDPHSPLVTFLWGHVGWLLVPNHELSRMQLYERYAKDLLRERFYMNLERRFLWVWINLAQWAVFYLGGLLIGLASTSANWSESIQFGLSVLVWGVFVRTVVVWHITWSINSVTHMWGYRNYDTDENSKNNVLIGLISNGEGWHNNHHAQPRAAAHGHKWWEFDVTYLTIQALKSVGLASKVVSFRELPPGRLVTNHQPVE
jgi:stearoyl-CoA desaturase (delta-9 desaturase)